MADNLTTQSTTLSTVSDGTVIATDDAGAGGHVQKIKLAASADGSAAAIPADATAGLKVDLGADNDVVVSDGGSSISVDDNGGSLTVDGSVAADTELTTADLDTGGGTDTRAVVGLVGSKSGGGQLIPGDATAGLKVDLGADNDVVVSDGGNVLSVDDAGSSLTVDNAALSVTGGGTEATALRVTVANDSTGVVSVDDNGSTLSVDDGAGSLTVDNAALSVTGGGTEATALRVTVANDSTGVLSIDDNGGSLTVDGTVTANQGSAGTAWEVVGDVAADVGVPGNPVAVGGRASDAVPTEVSADGDSVYQWLLRNGATMVANAPHLGMIADPYTLLTKTVQTTTTQTGSDILTVNSGKKLVVTYCQIQAGGTTAGTVQVWFGANADTSYTRGTDRAIFDGEFAPSSTLKPGFVCAPPVPWIGAADEELHLTTSAAINPLTITVWYYEV